MTSEHFSYCADILNHAVDIVEVARWLGMTVKGDRAPCPFHQEHTFGAFQFNRKEGYCHCHSCGEGRDIIGLVAYIKNVSPSTALRELDAAFHLNLPLDRKTFSHDQRKELSAWAKKLAEKQLETVYRTRLTVIRNELQQWKLHYAPTNRHENVFDARFLYAINNLETVELYLEELPSNTSERIAAWIGDMETIDPKWRQRRKLQTEMRDYLDRFLAQKIDLQTLIRKHGKAVKEYGRST